MRLSREPKYSLKEIAAWLKKEGYPRKTVHSNRKARIISENFLSDLFRDPFYAGAMVFGDQVVNLFDRFDFQPIITPEQFDQLAKENGVHKKFRLSEKIRSKDVAKADLMRGMVICAACQRAMSAGITPKKSGDKTTNYYYFRCDTPKCKYKGKSVRAKVIMEAAFAFLDGHPINPERGYKAYKREMEGKLAKRDAEMLTRHKSLTKQRAALRDRIEETKSLLAQNEEDEFLAKEFKADLKKQLEKVVAFDAEIEQLKTGIEAGKDAVKSFEEFIELFGNLATQIKKIERMDDLDFIMRKVFLNFTVDGQKVVKITQNSPFGELCEDENSCLVVPRGFEPLFTP